MVRTVSAAAVGLAALCASPAFALAPTTVKAHIPFAFTVGNVTLPAGDYRIDPMGGLDRNVLEIRSQDRRRAAVVLSETGPAGPRGAKPELVFDRYGRLAFLHAIELPEEPGAVVPASRLEVQTARELATRRAMPDANHK
jgi:hypothetical protein